MTRQREGRTKVCCGRRQAHGKARFTETEEGKQTRLRAAERDSGPRDGGRHDLQLFTGKMGQQPQDRYDPVPPTDPCLLQHAIIAARDTQP